jgi:hypothetical protein
LEWSASGIDPVSWPFRYRTTPTVAGQEIEISCSFPFYTIAYKRRVQLFSGHKQMSLTIKLKATCRWNGALAMTTPGDTTMATLSEVEKIMNGGTARVDR